MTESTAKEKQMTTSSSSKNKDERMTFSDGIVMQYTFTTTGALVILPYTFATLGIVTGPLFLLAIMLVTYRTQYYMNEMGRRLPRECNESVHKMALVTAGKKISMWMGIFQYLNLLLLMPGVLFITSTSLQYITNQKSGTIGDCNIIYVMVVLLPSIISTQFYRSIGPSTAQLARLSLVLVLIKSALIMSSVLTYRDLYESNASLVIFTGTAASDAGLYKWYNVCSTIGNVLYAFTPVFINTELLGNMKDRNLVHKQLSSALTMVYSTYLLVGITAAYTFGVSVEQPINLQLPYDWMGIAANAVNLYSPWVDYIIGAIICANYTKNYFDPNFDVESYSFENCTKWFFYSSPANIVATLLISFVPNFGVLIGICSAVSICSASLIIPALMILHFHRLNPSVFEGEVPSASPVGWDYLSSKLSLSLSLSPQSHQRVPTGSIISNEPSGAALSAANVELVNIDSSVPQSNQSEDNDTISKEPQDTVEQEQDYNLVTADPNNPFLPKLTIESTFELKAWLTAGLGAGLFVVIISGVIYDITQITIGSDSFFCDVIL